MLVVIVTPSLVLMIRVSTVRQSVLKSGYYAVRALRTGGGTGFYAALAGLVVAFHVGREERAGEVRAIVKTTARKEKRRSTHDPLQHGLILAAILFVLGLTGLVIVAICCLC